MGAETITKIQKIMECSQCATNGFDLKCKTFPDTTIVKIFSGEVQIAKTNEPIEMCDARNGIKSHEILSENVKSQVKFALATINQS